MNMFIHPQNKSSLSELKQMTIPDLLDYKELLDVLSMVELARQKDDEIMQHTMKNST